MQRFNLVSRRRNERLAFELYLRTGKIVSLEDEENLQFKFNPWHDPGNGRFTFAGQGNYGAKERQQAMVSPRRGKQDNPQEIHRQSSDQNHSSGEAATSEAAGRFNHFAQNSNFNRGVYRSIEDGRAKNIKAGKRVFVDIDPQYTGQSKRPDKLTIRWTVDNKRFARELPNEGKGQ